LKDSVSLGKAFSEARGEGFKWEKFLNKLVMTHKKN
jgi:hypothetical protein